MIQKIIRAGSSAAVTIPKKFLDQTGFKAGDEVIVETDAERKTITISPRDQLAKTPITPQFTKMVSHFIKTYKPALEKLARK